MRYFRGPSQVFDAYRASIIAQLEQPNGIANEPWSEGIIYLTLSPHEYEPVAYAAMIDDALQNGIEEIAEAEYRALQPPTPEA